MRIIGEARGRRGGRNVREAYRSAVQEGRAGWRRGRRGPPAKDSLGWLKVIVLDLTELKQSSDEKHDDDHDLPH